MIKYQGHDWMRLGDSLMDENNFNMAIRKYLKKVGVTSQREIEQAFKLSTRVTDQLSPARLSPDRLSPRNTPVQSPQQLSSGMKALKRKFKAIEMTLKLEMIFQISNYLLKKITFHYSLLIPRMRKKY